jgi:exopolysaccharide production protein ExoQ
MKVGRSIGLSKPPRGASVRHAGAPGRSRPADPSTRNGIGATDIGLFSLLLIGFCIYLATGPFTFTLTAQDPSIVTVIDVGNLHYSKNSQVLLYVVRFTILAVALGYAFKRRRRLVAEWRKLLPVAPFVAWALASVLWSDVPDVSLRNVAVLSAIMLAAYAFVIALKPGDLATAVVLGGVITAALSLLYVVFLPVYGIHQVTDATQAVHAGSWRGVYLHKNFLAHVMAAFAAATVWADQDMIGSRAVKWGLVAGLLTIMALTRSASAPFILPFVLLTVWMLVALSHKRQLKAAIVVVPGLVFLALAMPTLLELVGRDETFTGRDKVWQIAVESIMEHPIHGFGYVSISFGEFGYRLMSATSLIDPHSGYLDTILGVGVIGLMLFAIPIFAAYRSARQLYRIGGGERQAALMLSSLMTAWLVSCITESSDRPFTPMGGLGLFAMAALLALATGRQAMRQRSGDFRTGRSA